MKRALSFVPGRIPLLSAAGLGLIAATYGLVRLTYGLFLPDVQDTLGLGDGQAGHIASAASVVYCLGAVAGFFAAGHRARTLVVAAAASAAAGTLGMALAPTVGVFAPSAVLSSAAAGLASPALVTIVDRNVDAARRDRAQSVVNAGTGRGLVAAGLVALVLLPSWRPAWVLAGVATVLLAVAVLALDRDASPRIDQRRPALPPASWFRDHALPLAAATLLGAGSAVVWTYGRNLLLQAGASQDASTIAWAAIGLGGTAVVATSGAMNRLPPPQAWTLSTATTASACLVLAVAAQSLLPALLAFVVFGWGFVAATSALIAWAARIDAVRAAAGTAVLFVALVAGQSLGSTLAGYAVGPAGLEVVFLTAAVVTAGAAVVALRQAPAPTPTPVG